MAPSAALRRTQSDGHHKHLSRSLLQNLQSFPSSLSVDRHRRTPNDPGYEMSTADDPPRCPCERASLFAPGDGMLPKSSLSSETVGSTAGSTSVPLTPSTVASSSLPLTPSSIMLTEENNVPPTPEALWKAAAFELVDENGQSVFFGDLMPQPSQDKGIPPRTVVFFIRTFWCGQCQDYMFASVSRLNAEVIKAANVRVIIVSNGHWKVIKRYRQLFKCPFPIYVDAERELYQLFGLAQNMGPRPPMSERGAYHRGRHHLKQSLQGFWNGVTHMPRSMPRSGNLGQLGGEFVLAPGFQCTFAHRMTNRFDHAEAPDVLRAAGVPFPTKDVNDRIQHSDAQIAEIQQLESEMALWRERRAAGSDKILKRKAHKHGFVYQSPPQEPKLAVGLEMEVQEGWAAPTLVVSRRGESTDAWLDRAMNLPGRGREIELELMRRREQNKASRSTIDVSERKWFET